MRELDQIRAHEKLIAARRLMGLSIALSVLGETVIFLVWGVLLFREGDLVAKFLWTVVFCGFGMGSALGAALIALPIERLWGWQAVLTTALLSTTLLGVACNWLCFRLDAEYFHYFGGAENPILFLLNGVFMAFLGGGVIGFLAFTSPGSVVLGRVSQTAPAVPR